MPLIKSGSKAAVSKNIAEMINSGYPQKQAVAASLSNARKFGAKGRAMGGPMMPSQPEQIPQNTSPGVVPTMGTPSAPIMTQSPMGQTPMNAQAASMAQPAMGVQPNGINASGMPLNGVQGLSTGGVAFPHPKTFTGPIVSAVPGRTDKHLTHVPSGSYVIPADIVSGHGQGNSLAGMNAIHKLFRMGDSPASIPGSKSNAKAFAKGGADKHVGKPVPVILAGGEVVVPPENALETMRRLTKKPSMTLDQAHAAFDQWILKHRKKLIKTLKNLKPPAKD